MPTERVNILFESKGARKVASDVKSMGTASAGANKLVKALHRQLGLFVGIAGARDLVRTIANFGQEMATVRAITKATDKEFQSLREEAKRLGAETRFSTTQVAEAMTFLGRANFKVNEILQATEGTLRLAQAGALDLGTASDIASNVLTGFGLQALESGRAVDVLAKAANSGNTDVRQLGEALKFVAPVSKGLGVSLEETVASITALSDAGIQATMAGTAMRLILAKMADPTAQAEKALRKFGLTAEDINPKTVGFTNAIKTLSASGVGIIDLFKIFEIRGAPATAVLTESTLKLEDLTEALVNAGGTAEEVSAIMDDTLKGSMLRVASAYEALKIALGDAGLEELLRKTFDGLASSLRAIANNMDDIKNGLILLTPLFLATFGQGLLLSITSVTRSVVTLTGAMKLLRLQFLLNPVTLFATALATGITYLILFRDKIKLSNDSIATLGDLMRAVGKEAQIFFTRAFHSFNFLYREFKRFATTLGDFIREVLPNFSFEIDTLKIAQGLDALVSYYIAFYKTIEAGWQGMSDNLSSIFVRTVGFAIKDFVRDTIGSLPAGDAIANVFDSAVNTLVNKYAGTVNVFSHMKDTFLLEFSTAFSEFEKTHNRIWDRTQEYAHKRLQETIRAFENEFTVLEDLFLGSNGGSSQTVNALSEQSKITSEIVSFEKEMVELGEIRLTDAQRAEQSLSRMIREEQRNLALKKTLTTEQARQLELQYMIEDLESRGLETGNANIQKKISALVSAREESERMNASFVVGARDAFKFYLDDVERVADQSYQIFNNAFQNMEDALTSFVKTGEINFTQFIDSLITDLIRFSIKQAVLAPLFGGIQKIIAPNPVASNILQPIEPDFEFARGGILNQPTLFGTSSGVALAGEAGAEAVLPLKRLSNGELGVSANGGGGQVVFAPSIVVEVNGGSSDQQELGQSIADQVYDQVQAQLYEFVHNQRRAGNLLNPSGGI